jgi:hypothetical protein
MLHIHKPNTLKNSSASSQYFMMSPHMSASFKKQVHLPLREYVLKKIKVEIRLLNSDYTQKVMSWALLMSHPQNLKRYGKSIREFKMSISFKT